MPDRMRKIDLKLFDQYPEVCNDCGIKYGRREAGIHTVHGGTCGMCAKVGTVSPPRDYGYAKIL